MMLSPLPQGGVQFKKGVAFGKGTELGKTNHRIKSGGREMRNTKRALVMAMAALALASIAWAGGSQEAKQASGGLGGELIIGNWFGGGEYDMTVALEKQFQEKNPAVKVMDQPITGGDAQTIYKSMLMAGESLDLLLSTWPSLDKELVDAGFVIPVGDAWKRYNWGNSLTDAWKTLGTFSGKVYGVYWLVAERSNVWYSPVTFNRLALSAPKNWDELKIVCRKLKDAGLTPISVGAESWAHKEYFENLFLKVNGPDLSTKLVEHKIPWTDESFYKTLRAWKELLDAGFFADAETMLGSTWNVALQEVVDTKTAGMNLMGGWANLFMQNDFGLKPIEDYDYFLFPEISASAKNWMLISGKDWLVGSTGKNPEAAFAFIDYVLSDEGGKTIAKAGYVSPSSKVPVASYDAISKKTMAILQDVKVMYALGDVLPTELATEYLAQLQKFLSSPTEATIKAVATALEAKAQKVY
jgi:ABC-type glycerol-3-phosphate transport system substrate-binding protein